MKLMKILCVTALMTFAGGISYAHIVDGKWTHKEERPDGVYKYNSGMNAYLYRDSLMHLISVQRSFIREMAEGQIEMNEAEFIRAANLLSALVAQIPHAFKPEVMVPGSRAKPEIWQDWDGFAAEAQSMGLVVDEIARVAAIDGVEAVKPLVQNIHCNGCHIPYMQEHNGKLN